MFGSETNRASESGLKWHLGLTSDEIIHGIGEAAERLGSFNLCADWLITCVALVSTNM